MEVGEEGHLTGRQVSVRYKQVKWDKVRFALISPDVKKLQCHGEISARGFWAGRN